MQKLSFDNIVSKFKLILLIILTFLIFNNKLSAQDTPRIKISLFKYHGSEQDENYVGFNQFQGILQDKLFTLVEELMSLDSSLAYLSDLHVFYTKDYLPSSHHDISTYWENTYSLELLSGIIFSKDKNIHVKSRAFLGELKGELASNSINLIMRIVSDEFGTTRDSHSLIALYALAMDAERLNLPRENVVLYLSKAYSIILDLKSSLPEIKLIKNAIEKSLKSLKLKKR